jgi:hypothetical protein
MLKRKPIEIEAEDKDDFVNEKAELRRKTVHKIRKFLSGINENEAKVTEISNKIEEYIFKADNTLSNRYCRIAFLVLSALKVFVFLVRKNVRPTKKFWRN